MSLWSLGIAIDSHVVAYLQYVLYIVFRCFVGRSASEHACQQNVLLTCVYFYVLVENHTVLYVVVVV
jgi:hypothetical protein